MQKKLIALAIAGLSGAAFAQTNVTIYGVADASFDVISVSGGSASNKADTPSFTRVSTNGSYIGFRGTENLGNGMNAMFQFESNANFDTGGGLDTKRDSFVGLNGNFGTVLLGNLTGPTRALGTRLDVNTGDTIGSNSALLGKLGGALSTWDGKRSTATGSVFDTRFNNSVAYVTPSFSGFQATAAYVANENKSDNPAHKVNTSAYDIGANYTNGPLFIGGTYARVEDRNKTPGDGLLGASLYGRDNKATEWRLGGMYDFGNATIRALYARTKGQWSSYTDTTVTPPLLSPSGDVKQTVWGLGGTYNVTTNGRLTAQYYHAGDLDISSCSGTCSDKDTGAQFFSLGYEHSLSKRTMIKAIYSYLKNDDSVYTNGGGGYDYGYNASGYAGDELKISGLQIGLRHAF
jgi:predicted porin